MKSSLPAADDDLRSRWTACGYPPALLDKLLTKYRELHRHYHTPEHLRAAFRILDTDAQAHTVFEQLSPADRVALELAIWYHDREYDPQSDANELRSAEQFVADAVQLPLSVEDRERVVEMIMASREHLPPPGDDALALFCDLDLAILGESPDRYAHYGEEVRREYSHVSAAYWRTGRSHVLEAFLGRPSIFRFLVDREAQARENLSRELRALRP